MVHDMCSSHFDFNIFDMQNACTEKNAVARRILERARPATAHLIHFVSANVLHNVNSIHSRNVRNGLGRLMLLIISDREMFCLFFKVLLLIFFIIWM